MIIPENRVALNIEEIYAILRIFNGRYTLDGYSTVYKDLNRMELNPSPYYFKDDVLYIDVDAEELMLFKIKEGW